MAAKAINLRQLAFREVSNGRMSTEQALELLDREHHDELARTRWQAVWTWLTVAAIGLVLLFAFAARAQVPGAPSPASTGVPITWLILAIAILGVGLQFYRKTFEPRVIAELNTVANDTTKNQAVRTLAHVGADLEPVVASAVGHLLNDVSNGASAGKTGAEITAAAASDIAGDLHPMLRNEAVQLLGPAGGALDDFIEGLIHDKVQAAAAAGNAAALKITTPATAVAAMNTAVAAKAT